MGALISKVHLDKVIGYIDLAKVEGGTILTGGSKANINGRCKNGYFVEPTVFDGLSADCRTNQEEILHFPHMFIGNIAIYMKKSTVK